MILKVLVVDDDEEIRDVLTRYLQQNGFAVFAARTGAEVAQVVAQHRIDLLLLDVMLGDESGISICAQLRRDNDVPVIMMSALSADHHRMRGYEVGADDYVAKPFNPELLLARIRAVTRRGRRAPSLRYRQKSAGNYRFGEWQFDGLRGELSSSQGYDVALSTRELSLLRALLANPGIPLTREEIALALDPDRDEDEALEAAEGRAIDVLVARLRSKMEPSPKEPALIRTARGVGYFLACDVVREAD